ncbi:hypothetical protein ABC426_05360 [Lactiplantibacillus plantarum]|uniref:hypothetical protein n=1 Tax=Lactiplantibacillus plantarum TaxID=1590 RepID=UPI001BA8BA74|nr:hypothetical protein [Lactiplantibacillus plantarum]MBS0952971.1 hypothetical protein [Lactiplantibacillus plantarum]
MFDDLLTIDEKNEHYMEEKIRSLQHIFEDESKTDVADADRLRKVLAIFMDMQENSKKWTAVTKQGFVKKIKGKNTDNKLPVEVNEVLQQFAEYLKIDIKENRIPQDEVLKAASEKIYYSTLNTYGEMQMQDRGVKNKAEFFDSIKQFDSEIESFVGLTTKKMYDLSRSGVKDSKHEKTMNKEAKLNIYGRLQI